VLNIDLEDFFGSINFGRVRGMLMAMPYSLNLGIATLIAQICCYQNKLPKGAPTSPVISNMICADLDSKMKSLAKSNGCYYTRYADDITFSTKTAKFPPELATWRISDGKRQAVVGEKLKDLIEAAGFRVNESKTRLLSKSDRQVVTGLVVNRYVNVPRVYIRNIRAMLHAWQKYDKDLFNAEFLKRNPSASVSQITKIIAGKIQYIGYVRGRTDTVYCALRDRFNELSDDKIPVAPDVWMATLSANLWLIESHDNIQQGTAFYLEGVGLVTCAHCVGVKPFIRHPSKPAKKYDVTVKYIDKFRDVALLECTDASVESKGFKARKSSTDVTLMSEIVLAGYPNFGPGKSMSVKEGKVQSLSKKSGLRRINITANIISGNSGGPVFDRYKRVIGLAVTGAETDLESEETDDHGVIPIYEILNAMKPPVIPSPFETAPEPPLAPGL
jgi:S1-C subfamily serine protease